MEPVTRRSFLVKGGVGAAGAAAAFAAGSKLSNDSVAALSSDEIEATNGGPVLVQINDPETGEGEVLVGEKSYEFTDKSLVARVLRAGR